MKNFIMTQKLGFLSSRITANTLSLLLTLLFLSASCTHHMVQESDTVTDKIIKAYGGRELLAKVTAVAADGRITALMRGDEGTYKRVLRRDGKLLVDIVYNRSAERRILDGAKGFRGTGGQMEEVFGPRLLAMVYQYNELNLPYGLLDGTYTLTELPTDKQNGVGVRVFRLTDRMGNEMEMAVNADNFRIVKCTGYFAMGTQYTSLSSEYSDFRNIDGVLFPFKILNFAGGNQISEITMTRYVINPPIDDSLFRP